MDSVQRVVIHDKHPVFEPELLSRPLNRAVIGAAAFSLAVQIFGLVQVLMGRGVTVGWFDHVSFAAVAFLWLAFGVLVFLQRRAQRAGQLFLLSAAAGSMYLGVGTLSNANIVDALLYSTGLLLFPVLGLSFVRAFNEDRIWRRAELLLYLPPLLFIWPTAHDFVQTPKSLLWRIAVASVGVYFFAAMLQAVHDLLAARSPQRAAQTRWLLFGVTAGSIPAILIFIAPLASGQQPLTITTWQPHLVLLFLLAMSYAVLLFEFSEADLIVRRGVVYGMLTLVILGAYGLLGGLLAAGRASVTAPGGGLSFVAVTILVGAAFTPIRRAAHRSVDWLLYGRRLDRWQMLQALSARLSRIMQPDDLGHVLVREIAYALHLRGAFLLRRSDSGRFELRDRVEFGDDVSRRKPIPGELKMDQRTVQQALGDPPFAVLLVHVKPLTASHRDIVPDRYRAFDDLGVALFIPLVVRSGLEAVLCLQSKLAHDAFDADDLELLAPVMRQAAAALDNALLFSQLEEKVDELRHAYVRIAREQEAERARLARELHDGTAQELAGLITLATVAERQMTVDAEEAHATLDRLRRQAEAAYQDVRRASHALRPLMLDDFGLGPTLRRYLGEFEASTGISVDFTIGEVDALPDDVELALFRVAQECMENVRKHSGSDRAALSLQRFDGQVRLLVSDTGKGLPLQGERGIGLAGIRERIEAVGGVVRVESVPDQGVRVEAEVPLAEAP